MRILLISFSEHFTYQETMYNLHIEIDGKNGNELWTMGSKDIKYEIPMTKKNIIMDCPLRPGITKETFDMTKFKAVINKINEINPDRIMFYSAHIWNLFITLKLKRKYKIYHVIHDVIPHKGDKQEKFVYMYNLLTARLAYSIVLHNERYVEEFCSEYKYPREKVKFTELWRKYEDFTPLKHTGRCLFFGRINYYKGINNMLSIVEKCPDIQFDIVGRVDRGLEKVIDALKEAPNVHLDTNYVDYNTMRSYFDNADWVVMPYNSATQSGVIIDAYSFSRPIIAFNVGAISEQVKNGVSGFLVEPSNVDSFVDTLKKCNEMIDKDKMVISHSAWEYGFSKYSIQKGRVRFLQLFEEQDK